MKKDFFDYFKNSEMAFAIEIGNVDSFKEHIDPFKIIENFKPPQSFYYLPFAFQQNQ